jgi:8-oxo-dGTP diphosphatase
MKHYNVVAAVIQHEGRYLCMQKGETKYSYTSYKFEFPGGKIEEGETPKEALRRELIEEMDYEIYVGEAIAKVEYEYPDFFITLEAFLCSAMTTKFNMKEHISARWMSQKELLKLEWAAADMMIIKEIYE